MEKTRMYIFHDLVAEEPVLSSAYLCGFRDLEIKAVLLDNLMREPEMPSPDCLLTFETKPLRETNELLKAGKISEAYSHAEGCPHPQLWKLIAETALQKLDFATADKAFVQRADYTGVQFVKRLRLLDDVQKQGAEVSTYFGKFDEAEKAYREMDRRDLALSLRASLGEWFKVVQLVQQGGGDDKLLQNAWNQVGDHFYERQKISKAVQYYVQAKNYDALVRCYYELEEYPSLEKLTTVITDGSPLLQDVGHRLVSVGMAREAIAAFVKCGDIKSAIDACVKQHQWEGAVQLVESHNHPDIQRVLTQYAPGSRSLPHLNTCIPLPTLTIRNLTSLVHTGFLPPEPPHCRSIRESV
jgi:WD repeat-containing protein 35